jgi:hypothetical protein
MASTVQSPKMEKEIPNWTMTADYVETCNCDYGCPCNFAGIPTYGFCRALCLYDIAIGSYGNVKLDGLQAVQAYNWPKAIHEGDGTMQIYFSKKANPEQRKALEEIFYGRAKGNGAFAIFASTCKFKLDPQYVDIQYKIAGKSSSFSVPGVLEVQIENFKNPVTGAEQETEIHLPKGFIWKVAQAAKTKVMRIVSPNITFDDSGKNAFFCDKLEFKGP